MKKQEFAPHYHHFDDYPHEYIDGKWHFDHHHHWGDTEHACEVPPWDDCKPKYDDCICVTEDDVKLWNEISSVSAFKDLNIDALSAISAMDLPISANLWNSNYTTVYENSAKWNEVEKLDEISAYIEATNEVFTEEISQLKVNSLSAIHVNRQYLDEDYAKENYPKIFAEQGKVLNDDYPYVLQGNGTSGMPLELSEHVVDLLYYLEHGEARDHVDNIHHGIPSVPASGIFAKAEDVTKNKNDINYLFTLYKTMIQNKEQWVNKMVTLEESSSSGETFFYWTTK